MSKIKLYKAKFYDSHEGWWHYDEYNINCGSDGRFYTTIADEDVSIANNIINGCRDYSLVKNKIYSYQLRALENILDNILKTKKTLVKTEEFVIEYAFAGEIAYVKDDKGDILPCGKFGQENYKWITGALKNGYRPRCQSFSIALTARAYKIIKLYRDNVYIKEVYESPTEDEFKKYPSMKKLNDFRVGGEGFMSTPLETKRIPYSENAADFFVYMLTQMCLLYDKLNTFFDDDTNLLKAIENQDKPLLLEQKNEL